MSAPNTAEVLTAGGGTAPVSAPFTSGAIFWVLMAALVIAAAVLIICLARRRKPTGEQREAIPPTDMAPPEQAPEGGITVSRIHEIGKRKRQEDSLSVSPAEMTPTHGMLAVLADGMGGLSDGDLVSSTAVRSVMGAFIQEPGEDGQRTLYNLLAKAFADVKAALDPSQYGKSGSTLVMGLIRDKRFYYLSVGDSIICLYRNGRLMRLNRAHIHRNELVLRAINGEISLRQSTESRNWASLVSYLGMEELKRVDIPAEPVDIEPGDCFILMSDGVYNALNKRELCAALALGSDKACEAMRKQIEEKDYEGQDNYTAIVLGC